MHITSIYTVGQQKEKKTKKRNTPIYFNTNYRAEMKLVSIIMDYCLLQFDALKFFLGIRLHVGSEPNFKEGFFFLFFAV